MGGRVRGVLLIFSLMLSSGCSGFTRRTKIDDGIIGLETVYVRSSTAELALNLAELHRGDPVEILERRGDQWVKVRTVDGIEGWIEARAVARKHLVERARALARQLQHIPAQARGHLSGPARLRITPGRASNENVIMVIAGGTPVEIVNRQRTLKGSDQLVPKLGFPDQRGSSASPFEEGGTPSSYDEWVQVRLPPSSLVRAGWVYADLVDLDIPSRLVYFQDVYSIVGWFALGQVEDPDIGPVTHYLVLERRRDRRDPGIDFHRLRLFVWDVATHAYKSYWKRIDGILPVLRGGQDQAWVFRVTSYERKTGRRREWSFFVDVSDPEHPVFRRLRSSRSAPPTGKRTDH